MPSSRSRLILGTLSIVSLLSSAFFILKSSSGAHSNPSFYLPLGYAIIFSFNVTILFSWLAFGISGGVTISIISALMVFFFSLKMDEPGYNILALFFFINVFSGYILSKRSIKLRQAYILKSEKLDEDINLLANNLKEKKRDVYSLEEKLARYSLLKEVAESLSTVLSLDRIHRLIIDKAAKVIGKAGRVFLFMVDTQKQELILSASKDDTKVKAKKADVFDRWVLRNRKPLIVEDVAKDFRFPVDSVEGSKVFFKSLIASPLISQDKAIGVLRLDSAHEYIYAQDDLRLLEIIAHLGAVAIQNALLYTKAQELAIRDGLTGLAVRRYFMERFSEEIMRAARKKGGLSILMLDIDHFKDYNDKYGHILGDLVLKHLAEVLKSMVREGDVVGRYGGEEFVVLVLGRTKAAARIEADDIRKAIKDRPLVLRRHEEKVTVSVGLAAYPEDSLLGEELIGIADKCLYEAKSSGRDRVCSS